MNKPGKHTEKLDSLLQDLKAPDQTGSVREALLQHSMNRLETLTRRMLRKSPRVKRWEQTDDVFQNAQLSLFRALQSVAPQTPQQYYALAATQIRRELIDLARHYLGPEGQGKNHHSSPVLKAEEVGGAKDPVEQARANEPQDLEEWASFHLAVESLPEAEKEVAQLIWYEGMTQEQVADVTGVSLRTVKNRWRHAKLLLRERVLEPSEKSPHEPG